MDGLRNQVTFRRFFENIKTFLKLSKEKFSSQKIFSLQWTRWKLV